MAKAADTRKRGMMHTAFRQLALIGVGYLAKRMLTEPLFRQRVKRTAQRAYQAVKSRVEELRSRRAQDNNGSQVAEPPGSYTDLG